MRTLPISLLLLSLFLAPAAAQKRAATAKAPTFPEAIEQAKKAYDGEDYGAAVAALQAALLEVQKKQRVAVLAALPKPAGFTIRDEDNTDNENNPFAAGLSMMGATITRHYQTEGDKRMDVEVMANSPLISMMSMMITNPALAKANGAEVVEYGAHKALLKKDGDDGQELTILMHNKHMIKVTARAMTAEDVLAVFDQAAVDRLEKPLGK